jgi:glycerol-3-phosphate dehydrogenase subunit C
MAVSDEFRGPKAVGPQAQRFRHPRMPIPDDSLSWCSGCGICSQVCPHGVQVAEINIQAKARLAEQKRVPLRDQCLARPQLMGRLARPAAGLVNSLLRSTLLRKVMDKVLKIDEKAPLPAFTAQPLRTRLARHHLKGIPEDPDSRQYVAYFHGCSTEYFEPELGELTVQVLEHLGFTVILPPQNCCGLPLQSNGMFRAARRAADDNIQKLDPFIRAGIPLVGSSTSCTLALKRDYRTILGVEGPQVEALAAATRDVFEFLVWDEPESLEQVVLNPVERSILYHAPCHLRSHGIGLPALTVLRRIPGLEILVSDSACCGVAGTYGMKSERFQTAWAVGESLFQQALELQVDMVVTDSETCRWWIEAHSGVKNVHPIQILAWSMGLTSDPAKSW